MRCNRLFGRGLASLSRWVDTIFLWHDRVKTRHSLMKLSERGLQDLGIDRGQAWSEYDKPFWRE